MQTGQDHGQAELLAGDPSQPQFATELVNRLLRAGRQIGASDLHLQPTADGLEIAWRTDGVLQPVGRIAVEGKSPVVARLKVLSGLLTYRTDVPQEGRIRAGGESGQGEGNNGVEMRVSTFPTLYGERAVVRLFAADGNRFSNLADLRMPAEIEAALGRLLLETSGAIIVAGPAGSGKTTTAYACLREIVGASQGGRSIVSLEDPVETAVPGVAQSPIQPAAGFDFATGLRSLVRQDPEVILVGEVRDRATAEVAFQASLTGQLFLTTFHAPSATGAISRLADIGIEPYVLRSGILAVVAQRLVRRLCDCARQSADRVPAEPPEVARLGLPVTRFRTAVGCEACRGTGYRGRMVLAEMLVPGDGALAQGILRKNDSRVLEELAMKSGMVRLWDRACAAVESGETSPEEVRRVMGWSEISPATPTSLS